MEKQPTNQAKTDQWEEAKATIDGIKDAMRELLPIYRNAGRELVEIATRNPEDLVSAYAALGEEYADLFLQVGRGEIGPDALLIRLAQDAAKQKEAA